MHTLLAVCRQIERPRLLSQRVPGLHSGPQQSPPAMAKVTAEPTCHG